MSDVVAALVLGLVAGFAIAVPLGAIAVLLLRTGITAGWRAAAGGALGVASVDLVYAALATVAGSAIAAALDGHERAIRWVGAVVLAALATRGLWRAWSAWRARGAPAAPVPEVEVRSPLATGARFFGLTALNPVTVVYFAVVAAGFATQWDGAAERVAFVVGVASASAAWQLALAGIGAFAGSRAGPRVRTGLGAAGDVLVLGLAFALALG